MSARLVILGPPGCGKTEALLRRFAEELRTGTPPAAIAFVSFTRAARFEALARMQTQLGIQEEALPWVRTIHSAAFRLLDLSRGQVMGPARWSEFAEANGYQLTALSDLADEDDDGPVELPLRSADDALRYVYGWARNRRLDVERGMSQCRTTVPATRFRDFCTRVERFKREAQLVDFTDMLEMVLARRLRPPVRVAFVDELQDLSPLQIAVVEQWFGPCERLYVAGDDDQAVFSFQGADPAWLISLARTWPTIVLSQSYRVPRSAYAIAQAIIARNRNRVVKAYAPTPIVGEVVERTREDALREVSGERDTLILGRNRMFLAPVAQDLFDRRVPFVVEGQGGRNPLGSVRNVAGVRAACRLWRNENISGVALRALLDLVPSRASDLLPIGAKERAKLVAGEVGVGTLREALGLGALLDAIRRDGPTAVLLKLRPEDRAYFRDLLASYGEVPNPKVRLTSIHAAKGRQADDVLVLSDLSRAAYREYGDGRGGGYEAENRVAYVAVTRARERLVIVRASTRRHYDYPSLRAEELSTHEVGDHDHK